MTVVHWVRMASTSAAAFCLHQHENLRVFCTLILNLEPECMDSAGIACRTIGVLQQAIVVTQKASL